MNLLNIIKSSIHPLTTQYISHATLVEGVLRNHDHVFRCLFVDNSTFMNYLTARTYAEGPRVIRQRRVWIPSVDKMMTGTGGDFDLGIAVLPKRYDARFKDICDFKGDESVGQIIDISNTLEEIKKNFHQKKRQISNNIIQKSGLTYRISNDLKDFDLFYYQMFLPLIQKKHGDIASIESYEKMKPFFLRGFLLLVLSGEQAIAGALCLVKDNMLIFRRSGVLNGDDAYIKNGAQHALYLFNIMHAKELGLKLVDTMKSTFVMNDGVYRTKREWGAAVYPDDESECWIYFFIPRYTNKIAAFFEANPVIIHTKDGLNGLVGVSDVSGQIGENNKELYKKYFAPGLKNLFVLSPDSEKAVMTPFKEG